MTQQEFTYEPYTERQEPYLVAAVICDRVIEDAETHGFTLVNIYDRLTINPPSNTRPPSDESPHGLTVTIFLAFRTLGDYQATHRVRIILNDPDKRAIEFGTGDLDFERGNGANLTAKFVMPITRGGTHSLDIFLDDRFFTRLPLEILFAGLDEPANTRDRDAPVPS